MVDLAPLNPDVHGKLKVEMSKGVYASKQHMFPLRVNEIAQAIGSFPVLISRVQNTGDLSLSCLCSFTPQTNLFVENGEWSSDFKPFALDTAPFHLVADPEDRTKPVTGIDQSSQLLNKNSGNDIFDNKGKPSLWVKQLGHRLLDDIQNQALTRQFLKSLEDHQLLSPIDIVLNFEDGTHNRIRGLNMVNEERLKSLDSATLVDMRDRGFLPPIYALLFSVFQFNNLIRRNNLSGGQAISKINLEVAHPDRPI